LARRGGRVVGTNTRRLSFVRQIPNNGEEHEKNSDDDPNIDAEHTCLTYSRRLVPEERPRRSGAKYTGHQLAEGGVFWPSAAGQFGNSERGDPVPLAASGCCQSVAVEQQVSVPNGDSSANTGCGHQPTSVPVENSRNDTDGTRSSVSRASLGGPCGRRRRRTTTGWILDGDEALPP
jgi:hypothetical protein